MLIISILFIISIFSLYNICKIRKLYLSLQPQTRNNGAIAQLVEQRVLFLPSLRISLHICEVGFCQFSGFF